MVSPESSTGHERYVPSGDQEFVLEPNTVYIALHVSGEDQARYCREPGYRRFYQVPIEYLDSPMSSGRPVEKPVRRALNNPEIRDVLLSQRNRLNGVWQEDEPYPGEIPVPHIELDGSPSIISDQLLVHHHGLDVFTQLFGKKIPSAIEKTSAPKLKTSRLGRMLGWNR